MLEEEFPAKASYELSLKTLADLSDELDAWSSSLPPHLRLQFVQDKPSTGTISSRSPLLSLTYHYIRVLIQRPAICASLGIRSSSYMITMANSCKSIVQIFQLLKERGLSFSFCLNHDEVLVLSGFGLLFQGLNLESTSKILKDNAKMINAVSDILDKSAAPCASEFRRVAFSFLPSPPTPPQEPQQTPKIKLPCISRHNSDGAVSVPASQSPPTSTRKQLKAIASRLTAGSSNKKPTWPTSDNRRATVHNISLHPHGVPSQSVPSLQPPTYYNPASASRSEPARSPIEMFSRPSSTPTRAAGTIAPPPPPQLKPKPRQNAPKVTNLDYLSFGTEPQSQPQSNGRATHPIKPEPGPTDWEKLIGSLDNGQTNIYDACYGGPPVNALLDVSSMGMQHSQQSTVNDTTYCGDFWDLTQTTSNSSANSSLTTSSGGPHSILSFTSDDGNANSSTEDFTHVDWASATTSTPNGDVYRALTSTPNGDAYRAMVVPELGYHDELVYWNSYDASLSL